MRKLFIFIFLFFISLPVWSEKKVIDVAPIEKDKDPTRKRSCPMIPIVSLFDNSILKIESNSDVSEIFVEIRNQGGVCFSCISSTNEIQVYGLEESQNYELLLRIGANEYAGYFDL